MTRDFPCPPMPMVALHLSAEVTCLPTWPGLVPRGPTCSGPSGLDQQSKEVSDLEPVQ